MLAKHLRPELPQLQLPVSTGRRSGKGWLRPLLDCCRKQDAGDRPPELHVPDRTWRRHSALLMCLYEQRSDRGYG